MNWTKQISAMLLAGTLALGVAAPAAADKETRNTVIGAGLGGLAGALLSDGDGWVTLGGAAAGGVLGNIITDDDDDRRDRRKWDRRGHRGDDYRHASWRKHGHDDRRHWKKHRRHHRHD